jgi:hypothetical protein
MFRSSVLYRKSPSFAAGWGGHSWSCSAIPLWHGVSITRCSFGTGWLTVSYLLIELRVCPYGATSFAPRRPLGVAWARVREPPTGVLMTLLWVPTGLLHSLLGCSSEPLEGACGGLLGGSVAPLQCLSFRVR